MPARSGEFRHDGKLVVAGDDSGLVQVFDVNSRAVLRTLKGHAQPVHVTKFSPPFGASAIAPTSTEKQTPIASSSVLTCSDDSTVRLWDLATAATTSAFTGHDDYVRAGSFVPNAPQLVLSGSYDGSLRLWDSRAPQDSGESAWSADHGYPIESVVVHSSGTLAVSAGGPVVRIWDLLGGSGGEGDGRCLRAMSNHQKTVTSLAWTDDRRRLLSAGLDGLVKVYDASEGSWRVRHTMRYGGSLLSLGISPSDDLLLVGAADGGLSVRKRLVGQEEKRRRARGFEDVQRGLQGLEMDERGAIVHAKEAKEAEAMARAGEEDETTSEEEDEQAATPGKVMVVKPKKKKKLKLWDRMLKSFRYGDALDAVLRSVSLCRCPSKRKTLIDRSAERRAEHRLQPVGRVDASRRSRHRRLGSGRRHPAPADAVPRPQHLRPAVVQDGVRRHQRSLRYVPSLFTQEDRHCTHADRIADIYAPVIGRSPMIDEQFNKLRTKVSSELRLDYTLMEVNGQVEMVMAAAMSGLVASA